MKKHFTAFVVLSLAVISSAEATPPRSRGSVAEGRPMERPVIVEERPAGTASGSALATPSARSAPESRAIARGRATRTGIRTEPPAASDAAVRASSSQDDSGNVVPRVSPEMLAPTGTLSVAHYSREQRQALRNQQRMLGANSLQNMNLAREAAAVLIPLTELTGRDYGSYSLPASPSGRYSLETSMDSSTVTLVDQDAGTRYVLDGVEFESPTDLLAIWKEDDHKLYLLSERSRSVTSIYSISLEGSGPVSATLVSREAAPIRNVAFSQDMAFLAVVTPVSYNVYRLCTGESVISALFSEPRLGLNTRLHAIPESHEFLGVFNESQGARLIVMNPEAPEFPTSIAELDGVRVLDIVQSPSPRFVVLVASLNETAAHYVVVDLQNRRIVLRTPFFTTTEYKALLRFSPDGQGMTLLIGQELQVYRWER